MSTLALILGICMGTFTLFFGIYQRISCSVLLNAKCVGYREKYTRGGSTYYMPIFEYKYNNIEYSAVGYFDAAGFERHQYYEIRINPQKPNVIWHKQELNTYIQMIVLCIILIILALSGVMDRITN
ncbi:MAG: hypothetical protein K2G45_10260 [Lachnospiraceae bacterium]|nr:hypothetical protein [Lachnospiraceae bacterium]